MQAITWTLLPHSVHFSISMLKTRFNLCAHVIEARRSAGVCGSSHAFALLPLPRFAGVTRARCWLLKQLRGQILTYSI